MHIQKNSGFKVAVLLSYYAGFEELLPKFNAGSNNSYWDLFNSPSQETYICMENTFNLKN